MFPKVKVKPIPIRENEKTADNLNYLTITNRVLYEWGKHRIVTGTLSAPPGAKIRVKELKNAPQFSVNSYRVIP